MFPCHGYLELAKRLAGANSESCMRSAVSRAYYASLHKSKKLAKDNGATFSSEGTSEIHKDVIDYFEYHGGADFMSVNMKLGRLRKDRNMCDYDDSVKNINKTAENAIMDAEEIFTTK